MLPALARLLASSVTSRMARMGGNSSGVSKAPTRLLTPYASVLLPLGSGDGGQHPIAAPLPSNVLTIYACSLHGGPTLTIRMGRQHAVAYCGANKRGMRGAKRPLLKSLRIAIHMHRIQQSTASMLWTSSK